MSIKAKEERLDDIRMEMRNLVNKAELEKRELLIEERSRFDELEAEATRLKGEIEREESERQMNNTQNISEIEKRDIDNFAAHIRAVVSGEKRAENLSMGANGAVIPKTIVKKIIEKVEEISPIYQRAMKYNIGGTLSIPKEDTSEGTINVSFVNEFDELVGSSTKTASIELTGYLYGALTKISKSLLNNTNFDLTSFVIKKMAERVAAFIEGILIFGGNDGKVAGIAGSYDKENMQITLADLEPTADELIDLQECVPDRYQANCLWVMSKNTRTAIRKLKDGDGTYLLQKDSNSRWGYTLFGKDVFISDSIPKSSADTAGQPTVLYGDFTGLAVKEAETFEMEILLEKFATQHAIGVVGWGEIDSKIEDVQKIAVAVATGAAG